MDFGKLSIPWTLIGNDSLQLLKDAEQRFHRIFMKKERRPYYKGKFIFFDISRIANGQNLFFPERFTHICSIEDKESYTMFPCNNDLSYALCNNKCDTRRALSDFQFFNRSECLFRASRLHWIPEIINLANNDDKNIMYWTKPEKDKRGAIIKKHYIRYEENMVDYVVILKEEWTSGVLRNYKFISAFPVFLKGNKKQFDRDFIKFRCNPVAPVNSLH